MTTINDWKNTPAGTIKIDWEAVETKLGFKLHENIKDFYSRVLGGNSRRSKGQVEGCMEFKPKEFVKEYVNRANWLENSNGESEHIEYELYSLEEDSNDSVCEFFQEAFFGEYWTGGHDFGHRAKLGELFLNIGQIVLIFNNDTGRFEWVDFGYGYFEVYEKNPYGIVADTAQEFLDKFSVDEEIMRILAELEAEEVQSIE